ncbi:MAG: putative DNA binding domain-containing protein [Clostridiales bacterium]|jgi:ATP-dependent DNA helicase RecG|nr:putative DNA binding domain-containing protein [Clostridiales bacterium]
MYVIGEDKFTEYKREYTKTFLKTVSAYANFHNGVIIFGLDDQHGVIGIGDTDNLRLAIEHGINDSIEPTPYYEIEIETIDSKKILVLSVFKGEHTPYYCSGKAYNRFDTSTVQVDRNTLSELILSGRNICFDEQESDIDDLSFNFLLSRLNKAIGVKNISEDLLRTLLLKKMNKYTNAAILFSDFNPMKSAIVHLIAYEDDSVGRIVDRDILEEISIIEQYERCIQFYRKHLNIGEIIEGPYRETVEEIPMVAFREAITNALAHRDYSRDVAIRVEIFSNRIEIVSPGSLPVGLSVDEFENGSISLIRNRIIADLFRRLNLVEKFGTGIRRIKEYYKDYQIKPVFCVKENSVAVILPKFKALEINRVMESKQELPTDEREKKIYEMLMENNSLTRIEIEKALNLGRSQTGDILKAMKEKSYIVKLGNGRTTKYSINSKKNVR